MSQTLVSAAATSFDPAALRRIGGDSRTTWASPGADLWIASRTARDGVEFLGFVERSLDDYIAVDGAGASMGRHADLVSAQRAVAAAHSPASASASRWNETGAPVLSVRTLRAR